MRVALVLLTACIGSFATRGQSPWVRPAAGAYVQLGYHTIPTYSRLFGKGGEDLPLARHVAENTLQLYGEYGLGERTTAVVSLPFRLHQRGARTPEQPLFILPTQPGRISGVGNLSLAVRRRLSSGPLALSVTLRLDLPSTLEQPTTGLRTGFNAFTLLPLLSLGQGLGKAYWFAYGGMALRTNHYNHYFNAGTEGGVSAGPFWLIAFVDAVLPFENAARPLQPLSRLTGLYENNQGWLSPGIKAAWSITDRWGLIVSAAGALWAQYVPKSPGISAVAFYRWP